MFVYSHQPPATHTYFPKRSSTELQAACIQSQQFHHQLVKYFQGYQQNIATFEAALNHPIDIETLETASGKLEAYAHPDWRKSKPPQLAHKTLDLGCRRLHTVNNFVFAAMGYAELEQYDVSRAALESAKAALETTLKMLNNPKAMRANIFAQMINTVASDHLSIAHGKNILVKINADPRIKIQETLNHLASDDVYNIVDNLILNAIKYTPQDGHVIVNAAVVKPHTAAMQSTSQRWWALSVEDNGLGIPEKDHEKVLHGQRASNVGNIPGTGFGLQSINKAIEDVGGFICITSPVTDFETRPGTRFTCYIPLKKS